ncbi:MAG: tetratricopeptide repeat protein [Betaproteobacteria bacterium]
MTLADSATVAPGLAEAVQLHTAGELDAAAAAYELLISGMAEGWEPRFLLGLVRFQQSNFASAQRWLLETTRLNAGHADAWYYLGESLAGQGQVREAEAAYAKAGTQFSPHAMASFKLAQLLESRGALSDAREAYRAALAGNPDFPEALNNLGLLLRNSGAVDEAETLLRRALQLRPDFSQAYINLAGLLTERGGAAQAGVTVLKTGIQACSASAELHFHLAAVQARSGDREAAVASYEQVLAIDANHAEAYNNVGVLFLEEGFLDEARVCFERATTLKPHCVEASNNLTNLLTERTKHDAARATPEHALTIEADIAEACTGSAVGVNERGSAAQAVERARAPCSTPIVPVRGLPNFLIVGVPKAGTTTLHYILNQHQSVCLPLNKEAHFFDDPKSVARGAQYYSEKHFAHWQGQPFVGDITPRYFTSKLFLRRISEILGGGIKVVVIFRFPVMRAFSHYTHEVFIFKERRPFINANGDVRAFYTAPSLYANRFAYLIELFGRENILPLIFERDIAGVQGSVVAYRKIAAFLGLPEQADMELNQQRSKSFRPRIVEAQRDGVVHDHAGNHEYRRGDIVILSVLADINVMQYKIVSNPQPRVRKRWLRQMDNVTASLSREELKRLHQRYFRVDIEHLKALLNDPLPEWQPETVHISTLKTLPPLEL